MSTNNGKDPVPKKWTVHYMPDMGEDETYLAEDGFSCGPIDGGQAFSIAFEADGQVTMQIVPWHRIFEVVIVA